jgi:hypothetical protein
VSSKTISAAEQRRFILGRQGLWPGRRWSGKEGTAEALLIVEAVQIDPVSVVDQSHDIVLWGRVLDYQAAYLRALAYEDRQFFDYGGALYFYPMAELPYWRVAMERHKRNGRWHDFMSANAALLDQVRAELRDRGPLRSRDVQGKKVNAYRSGKDTGVAMYAMWISGELMTYGRHGRERIYDFMENIAPQHLQYTAGAGEAETYFLRKALAQRGLTDSRTFRSVLKNVRDEAVDLNDAQNKLHEMADAGVIESVQVEGRKETFYYLSQDRLLLEALANGEIPPAWQPLGPTTQEEVTFLSPLEYVSARRRALKLFDFDYIWEIYKPLEKRVYGPYTMPILYGDRLVGRMDARHDRPQRTLVINGLWLEEWFEPDDAFADALTRGLSRFVTYLSAERVHSSGISSDFLRQLVRLSMTNIHCRWMEPQEVSSVAEIDRSERIRTGYTCSGDELQQMVVNWDSPPWAWEGDGDHTVAAQVRFCSDHLKINGRMYGAFDGQKLVGIGIIQPQVAEGTAQLAYLHVSNGYRQTGIGGRITAALIREAKRCGARTMYVSATPSGSAVGFYLSHGFEPTDEPIPELFAKEPDDIHMVKDI